VLRCTQVAHFRASDGLAIALDIRQASGHSRCFSEGGYLFTRRFHALDLAADERLEERE
jgi:hypothetical protein